MAVSSTNHVAFVPRGIVLGALVRQLPCLQMHEEMCPEFSIICNCIDIASGNVNMSSVNIARNSYVLRPLHCKFTTCTLNCDRILNALVSLFLLNTVKLQFLA